VFQILFFNLVELNTFHPSLVIELSIHLSSYLQCSLSFRKYACGYYVLLCTFLTQNVVLPLGTLLLHITYADLWIFKKTDIVSVEEIFSARETVCILCVYIQLIVVM
jgi:hypothetical protein